MEYSVLTDVEHLKQRKAVYIGEVSNLTKDIYVYDFKSKELIYKPITYNTGLLKLFDEIFSNAIDNYQRTLTLKTEYKTTNVHVELHSDHISVYNDGQSIPVKKQKVPTTDEEMYIPQMIFTLLRSGSNFDDKNTKRTWGGMNGMGSKIVAFLSHKFEIELMCDKTFYHQIVYDSTSKIDTPRIKQINSTSELNKYASDKHSDLKDYTKITYYPIFEEFDEAPKSFDSDFKDMVISRVFDVAYLPLDLTINDKQIPRLTWNEFVQKHANATSSKSKKQCSICTDNIINCKIDNGWLCSVSTLNPELKTKVSPISYVNYICTQEGGTHVNYVVKQLTDYIKSKNKSLKDIKTIKDKLFICLSAITPNPDFESQAKNRLTKPTITTIAKQYPLQDRSCDEFMKGTSIIDLLEGKAVSSANKETRKKNVASIPKAKDATYAGDKDIKIKSSTRLILTEGDSALTTAVHGVEHIKDGVKYFGMFPLRGKSLNVRANSFDKYYKNEELKNIKILLGLEDGKTYTDIKQLRYGGVILMTDADTDGAHIKSLIINFFDVKFPSLLKLDGFIREFITPMIKITIKTSSQLWKNYSKKLMQKAYKGVSKDTWIYPLYNRIEFEKFENEYLKNVSKSGYEIDYIKGLATIEKSDTEEYFDNFEDSEIKISFDEASEESLDLAFSKKREDDRKEWIGSITEDTHLERIPREPITCADFINTDLCLYSFDNCVRSIPCAIDGLKPTQRKILCSMLGLGKKAYNKIKVTELGGLVTKDMKYEHGDISMNETIICMAQDFAGSNNINLLMPIGQLGSRRQNGEDHGSPRYVHVSLNPLVRKIFPEEDDVIYKYRYEEGEKVEPIYYIPIIPMVLVNGAKGIGTGWSTEIPPFDPKELTRLVIELVNGKRDDITALDLPAHMNGFNGEIIYELSPKMKNVKSRNPKVNVKIASDSKGQFPRWLFNGDYKFERKHNVLKLTVKDANPTISVDNICDIINKMVIEEDSPIISFTQTKFSVPEFTVEFDLEKKDIDENSIVKMFKLNGSIASTNMVLFDEMGKIQRYKEIYRIVMDWFVCRYECYEKRIEYIIKQIERELMIISNKYRFVKEIAIDKTLDVNNKRKSVLESELEDKEYDKVDDSFNYLLSMPIHSLTKEKLDELKNERKNVQEKLDYYKNVSVEELWTEELNKLYEEL